jgi:hypothetical protein
VAAFHTRAVLSESFVYPDIGTGQQTIECGSEPIKEAVDPVAIIAVGIADKNVVLEAWDEGHGEGSIIT